MAVFISEGGGCQASAPSYWRADRIDSTGKVILACSDTEAGAESLVDHLLSERENFLTKSNLEQLDIIANKKHILSSDMEAAIRLINKILNIK